MADERPHTEKTRNQQARDARLADLPVIWHLIVLADRTCHGIAVTLLVMASGAAAKSPCQLTGTLRTP